MRDRAGGAALQRHGGRLESLEALRAAAALLVVLFHTQFIVAKLTGRTPFADLFAAGDRGVDLFFVLSGFVICHRHAGDAGHPARLPGYLRSRVCRIYPLVWAMTGLAVALYASGFGDPGKAGKLSPLSIVTSALLVPHRGTPLVNVTWSLQYEMMFYGAFALLIASRRLGVAVLLVWQGAAAAALLRPEGGVPMPLDPVCLDFGIGLLCALGLRLLAGRREGGAAAMPWLLAAALALFLAGMAGKDRFAGSALVCAAATGLLIVALVRLEEEGRIRVPAVLARLGGASYGIYMVHYSAVTLLAALAVRAGLALGDGAALALASGGVAAGCAVDRWFDQPVQRWLKGSGRAARRPARSLGRPATEPA